MSKLTTSFPRDSSAYLQLHLVTAAAQAGWLVIGSRFSHLHVSGQKLYRTVPGIQSTAYKDYYIQTSPTSPSFAIVQTQGIEQRCLELLQCISLSIVIERYFVCRALLDDYFLSFHNYMYMYHSGHITIPQGDHKLSLGRVRVIGCASGNGPRDSEVHVG